MKSHRLLSIASKVTSFLMLCTMIPFGASADIDKKFYDKAAKEVWGMELPQFDPDTDLSDSIYRDRAAVYIARYRSVRVLHDESSDKTKELLTGLSNRNAVNAVEIDRTMVKIIEPSATEKFSTFSVKAPISHDIRGFKMASITPAFGARIIRPDGTVEEVDMAEAALPVTVGKKGTDAEYKIAIPGLEPGVILDYFFYREYFLEEQSMPWIKFDYFKSYPTKNFILDIKVSPDFALEYSPYNGAPDFMSEKTSDGLNHLWVHLADVDAIEQSTLYYSEARQMPHTDVYILNNRARLGFVPKSARPGGVRTITYPQLLNDIANAVTAEKYPDKTIGEAESIVKDWKKKHPQASEREIVDAAYVAMNFARMKHNERLTERQFSKSFSKLLENLSVTLPGRVAVTSPRSKVPVDKLVHFSEATYFVTVGDSCYFPSSDLLVPGEIPGGYDTEQAFRFERAPYLENLHTVTQPFTVPRSMTKDNTLETITDMSLDPENMENMVATTTVNIKGAPKIFMMGAISFDDVCAEWTRFLGQKPLKHISKSDPQEKAEEQREAIIRRAETVWNTDNPIVDSYEIPSIGCTPDNHTATLVINGKVDGVTASAGDDLLVNIGKFTGKQQEVTSANRRRDISIVKTNAEQFRHTLNFKIPEGYEVVPESVTSLNKTITSANASFIVETAIDDGVVTIRVVERHPCILAPVTAWPDMLSVLDAAAEFSSASIVLRPK